MLNLNHIYTHHQRFHVYIVHRENSQSQMFPSFSRTRSALQVFFIFNQTVALYFMQWMHSVKGIIFSFMYVLWCYTSRIIISPSLKHRFTDTCTVFINIIYCTLVGLLAAAATITKRYSSIFRRYIRNWNHSKITIQIEFTDAFKLNAENQLS